MTEPIYIDGDTLHIVPVNDLVAHDSSDGDDCVCGPDRWLNDHGVWIVEHHSLDGRELLE